MESPKEPADSALRTFSQVLFMDIPKSYPPSTSITCSYNLTASFQPNPRDWVGVFKVGWSTTKDYHTFVWVEPCLDVVGQQSRQAVFKDYYLPKDEIEFYQFCYVDSTGQVRGASTPFCFRSPTETSLESSPDDDLLVITTQEQVDQSVREKAELQRELDQIMAENESLKNARREEQQEAANFKKRNEEKEKENHRLHKEMDVLKMRNEHLDGLVKQQQEDRKQLEETLSRMTKQMHQDEETEQRRQSQSLSLEEESKQKEKQAQEKYDRAVVKINQMKAEREELKERLESQSSELTALNSKLKEQERELLKMKDNISLLQVDLQSSEKEKERLSVELQRLQTVSHNVDDLQRENQELTQRLSHLETMNSPDDNLRTEYQTLAGKLQDAQVKLATEREESRAVKSKAELLDRELQDTKEQLKKTTCLYDEAQRTANKQELKLSAANELIADKESIIEEKDDMIRLERHEKEELTRENKTLIRDIEGLRRLNADLQAASPVSTQHTQPEPTAQPHDVSHTPEWAELETPEQEQHQYETIGSIAEPEEESLVCAHCQERFPGITPEELEQHEQSHRVCPFCTMICDNMEQSVFEDHVYGHEL
ncbi:calcium-binding and coiled-coil domain-containing protein 2 isoform X2 [Halichoeres trimaculatus]|uniref:calcium-binding and coiled-coil domain-containing protein 2 isoform X2 n=1 Tax=Halichoeres trimaculatus TaxID=147232 RepID=UPI003D9E409E